MAMSDDPLPGDNTNKMEPHSIQAVFVNNAYKSILNFMTAAQLATDTGFRPIYRAVVDIYTIQQQYRYFPPQDEIKTLERYF